MQNLFSLKFDAIYMLTLCENKIRHKAMQKMFNHIGLDLTSINIHYGCKFPYNNIIMDAFNNNSEKRCFTKPNEYDCARNHYSIIKEAYELGYNNVLILEDDIQFNKDLSLLRNTLNNIPEDYDILQFGAFTVDPNINEILDKSNENIYWSLHPNVKVWTTSMYALSRVGMQYYLKFMDKWFTVADMPLYYAPINKVKAYLTTTPIVIQADKNTTPSDIRTPLTDTIDYNNDNLYESRVDKKQYFSYEITEINTQRIK